MEFSFLYPAYLILLLIVPFIVFIHFFTLRTRRKYALRFANFEAIRRIRGIDLLSKNIMVLFLTTGIFILLTLSLSGMQVIYEGTVSSFSFVLALDTSSSMGADDLFPSRLETAKQEALSFIDLVPDKTKIALLSFSGNSLVLRELTNDKILLRRAIESVSLSDIGGTDIVEALVVSSNLLRGEEGKSIILMSDGISNVGTLEDGIAYANQQRVVVHTFALGTESGGITSYGLSKADQDSLHSISYNTNGKYFLINTSFSDEPFQQILGLRSGRVERDISAYLLLGAIGFFLLEYLLITTRYRVFP